MASLAQAQGQGRLLFSSDYKGPIHGAPSQFNQPIEKQTLVVCHCFQLQHEFANPSSIFTSVARKERRDDA